MANAGISGPTKASNWSGWQRVLNINLFGVINTVQTFLPMIKSHQHPSLIINTGSKQGITTPPASGPAYNVSKAGVKIFTEQLAHELREEPSTAHIEPKLLIPGYVFTNLSGMVRDGKPKPDGAWTVEQTVDYMMQQLQKGSFYILCPDNTTPRELDLKRMQVRTSCVSALLSFQY
jgi:NAD(P)-dependent dehydrogenase (short-subunit alcohol dehydrogenase family)